jgi:hypothetical protein
MWTTVIFCGFLFWLFQAFSKCLNFRHFAVHQNEPAKQPEQSRSSIKLGTTFAL